MEMKMKKIYKVELTETVKYFGVIEAESLEDAATQAKKLAEDNAFPDGEQELLSSEVAASDGEKQLTITWEN